VTVKEVPAPGGDAPIKAVVAVDQTNQSAEGPGSVIQPAAVKAAVDSQTTTPVEPAAATATAESSSESESKTEAESKTESKSETESKTESESKE